MNFGSKSLLVSLLTLQFMLVFSMYWDTPIVRQVLGFLYLTFVPGIVILKLLKLEKLSLGEVVSLSMGLSIAFLMFFGLLINELLPLVGISKPLSAELLVISLNLLVTLSCLVWYSREKAIENIHLRLSFLDLAMLLALTCLPILSVVGTVLMNTSGNNSLLLLMIILVPISALMALVLRRKFTLDIFPMALLTIYLAILFATWLTTNYILGYDSHSEFYSFKLTENASLWNPVSSFEMERDKANAMLSTTVLPTIYSNVMNLDATWVFKIIYPLFASFVPLGLYQLYLTHTRKEAAFLGTFLFIIHSLDGLGSLKEWVASIFYVLLFFIIFSDKIPSSKKKILFIVFAGALVVSHYAKSYIFIFILIFMWAISFILKKNARVTLSMVLIFLSMAFAWYIFTMQATSFEALVLTVNNINRSLTSKFFNPASRGSTVMTALGLIGPPTYLHLISRLFFYLTILLITLGFISLTMKFRKTKSNLEYFVVACFNMGLLAMTVILPNFAESFKMGRFYRTTLVILAPLCVLGGEEILANMHRFRIASWQKKWSALMLVSVILVPHFIFQTEFVYEITKVESWSIPLSRYRMSPKVVSDSLLYETDVFGAVWLFTKCNYSTIYADYVSKFNVLTSYGLIDYGRFGTLANTTTTVGTGSLIYLRHLNTVNEIMVGGYVPPWNTTNMLSLFNIQNEIYSNGDCSIYKNPSG